MSEVPTRNILKSNKQLATGLTSDGYGMQVNFDANFFLSDRLRWFFWHVLRVECFGVRERGVVIIKSFLSASQEFDALNKSSLESIFLFSEKNDASISFIHIVSVETSLFGVVQNFSSNSKKCFCYKKCVEPVHRVFWFSCFFCNPFKLMHFMETKLVPSYWDDNQQVRCENKVHRPIVEL